MSSERRKHYTQMIASGAIVAGKVIINGKEWKNPLDGIDVEAEYDLIQKKQSTLSKSLRDLVVFRWDNLQSQKAAEGGAQCVPSVDVAPTTFEPG